MFISIIIPAYNEGKRIQKTLMSVNDYMSKQSYDYEILVVNDGSKDNTAEITRNLAKTVRDLKLIDNRENHGKGWAVRQGMLEARGDLRLFTDADNSTTIEQMAGFLPYFSQGYDIVIGSRQIEGAVIAVKQPWSREFLGRIFRLLVRILVPLGVKDSQAGFKMFTARAAQTVFSRQTIFRWAFDVEILTLARKAGLKIKEAPIRWMNEGQSHVKIKGMIAMLFEVARIRLNLWTNHYEVAN